MASCARKARIEWLQKGVVARKDDVQYVLLPFGMRVSRVNLIATAVEKRVSEDGSFCSIILDDGTDTIPAKFFGETLPLSDLLNVGDILVVIGGVREVEGERSIIPDIVRKADDPNVELLRELELRELESSQWKKKKAVDELRKATPAEKLRDEAEKAGIPAEMIGALLEYEESLHNQDAAVEEKIFDLRQSVMEKIIGLDSGEGVPYEKVVSAMPGHGTAEVEKALGELLNSGEIYEPVAGIYRIL